MGVFVTAADNGTNLQLSAIQFYAGTTASYVQTKSDAFGIARPGCHCIGTGHDAVAGDGGGLAFGMLFSQYTVPRHPLFCAQAVPAECAVATLPCVAQNLHGTGEGVLPTEGDRTGTGKSRGQVNLYTVFNKLIAQGSIVDLALTVNLLIIGNSANRIHK